MDPWPGYFDTGNASGLLSKLTLTIIVRPLVGPLGAARFITPPRLQPQGWLRPFRTLIGDT